MERPVYLSIFVALLLNSQSGTGQHTKDSRIKGRPFGQFQDFSSSRDVGFVCERPQPPNRASMSCHQSNKELKCTAKCMDGFHFPESYPETIELECDASGTWYPSDRFPDCIGQGPYQDEMEFGDFFHTQQQQEYGGEDFGSMRGMYGGACEQPGSPMGGSMNCVQRNAEMVCTAVCMNNMRFPDGYPSAIQITCDVSGYWQPYDEFPDCIGESRYGQEQSGYDQVQSGYGREQSGYHQVQSGYHQGQYQQAYQEDDCVEPDPPTYGSLNCVRRNERLYCTATCVEGFSFPESYPSTIQITCDAFGSWVPYDEFPDCIAVRSSAYNQHYQTQQRQSAYVENSGFPYQEQQPYSSSSPTSCTAPLAPAHGTIYCMDGHGQRQCQATCDPGYEFPDRTRQLMIACDYRSGYWMPKSGFEDCELLCHPPCQNGGQCGQHGVCHCSSDFRGNRCQYPISLCDFNRLHPRMVAFECRHNEQFTECTVSCSPGMVFDPPSTTLYRCTVDGHWNPPTAPTCMRHSVCDQPPSPMNGRISCSGNNEKLLCTGSCRAGYEFPDGFSELVIQCSHYTGQWSPAVNFEDCIPICNPECQNGGRCIGHNQCLCTSEYRGSKCEYAFANCDYHTFLKGVVAQCKEDKEETVCEVSCGNTGAILTPSQPKVYTCNLAGTWTPVDKPICEADYSLMDMRTSSSYNKGVTYSESSTRYKYRNSSYHESSRIDSNFGESGRFGTSGQNGQRRINNPWTSRTSSGYGQVSSEFLQEQGSDRDIHGYGDAGHDLSLQNENRYNQEAMDYGYGDFGQEPIDIESFQGKEQAFENFGTLDQYMEIYGGDTGIGKWAASRHRGVCSVWGHTHFTTFSGDVYDFAGVCSYILVEDVEHEGRSINLVYNCDHSIREMELAARMQRMREYESSSDNCVREIDIRLPGEFYKISTLTDITLNGKPLSIPVRRATGVIMIEKVSRYIVVQIPGFTVWINEEGTIRIEADQSKRGKTSGLCGNFDHLHNDFRSPDGRPMPDIITFGKSWKTLDDMQNCVDNPPTQSPCRSDTEEHLAISNKASLMCESLRSMEYASCHKLVDPQDYYTMCQIDCCATDSAEGCECASLDQYFKECARAGGDMERGWRRPALCPLPCANSTEYHECGPACRSTCERQNPPCAFTKCVDGCFCPEGKFLEAGKCIPTQECPCSYGKSKYASGDVIHNDCNTCICEGGLWVCTEETCPATCYVSGPHFTTFDGERYYLNSKCPLYLVNGPELSISIDYSTNCRESELYEDEEPVCIRSITVLTPEDTIVKLKPGFEVVLNGEEIDSLPVSAPGIHVGQSTSMFMKATMKSGLEIVWDGGQQIFVTAPVALYDKTQGLCGTFNHKQSDDFLTPDGDIESVASNFAEKWKVDMFCEDHVQSHETEVMGSCDRNAKQFDAAARACSIMKTNKIFEECHGFVDPTPYYTSCMEDFCDCQFKEIYCLCSAISSYAAVCARKGHPITWRSEIPECAIHCPVDQVYTNCAKSCSYSCAEIARPQEECKESCIEGCVCPAGQTMDDQEHECIPVSSCHCAHSGRLFPPEFRQRRGHEMCECAEGQWECRIASAKELVLNPPTTGVECSSDDHMQFTDCVSHCPLTCSNLDKQARCSVVMCEVGCKCEDGYVLDGSTGKCILPHQCPCHHAGHSYTEGTELKIECNDCVCNSGHWECQSNPCPGVCSVWGNSHYKTFDDRVYDFQGECNYELLRGPSTDGSAVSVTIHNLPCGTRGVTCGKAITVSFGEYSVTVSKEEPVPVVDPLSGITIKEIGMFVIVHVDSSISVQWDRDTRIYLTAQPMWKSKLSGLCGDFNGDANDDFKPPSGGVPLTLAEEFADSWRVYDYCDPATSVSLGCENNPEKRVWAREKCSVLQTELFEPCHTLVEAEEYFRRCMDDACSCDTGGDCDCLCEVVATYAQECARKGVEIEWRSQELCPIQCEECDHYSPCIDICEPINCENYQDDIISTCTFEPCVEGCEPKDCPPGYIRTGPTNKTCIRVEDCSEKPCIIRNGVAYKEGARIDDPEIGDMCQSCFCHEGKISCEGSPCTTTPYPTSALLAIIRECEHDGWSEWVNSVHPEENDGSDREDLQTLISIHQLPCDANHIKKIECREVSSGMFSDLGFSKGVVACNVEMGLACDKTNTDDCEDHEIRVYCDCPEEKEVCPPGLHYENCAFHCGSMCQSLESDLEMSEQCDDDPQMCLPGCVEKICRPPYLRRDAETCVLAESCTCKLENETLLAPGHTGDFGCQKCQCLDNEVICMYTPECATRTGYEFATGEPVVEMTVVTFSTAFTLGKPPPTSATPSVAGVLPAGFKTPPTILHTTSPPFASLPPILQTTPPPFSILPPILQTTPPTATSPPTPAILPISIPPSVSPETEFFPTATETTLEEMFTTPVTKLTTEKPHLKFPGIFKTTTVGCSYWSDWINDDIPRRELNGGDRETTLPYVLKQTEGFCQDGIVTDIECELAATGIDYTASSDKELVCDVDHGFICNNRDQLNGKVCQDYQIRYYCTCEAVETTTIFVQTTTKTHVYPCTDLMKVIDGFVPFPDSSLKASSSRSPNEGPEAARLSTQAPGRKGKTTLLGGSWTAEVTDEHQYIEVNLGDIRAIYGIITLGKAGSNDWVTAYRVLYSTDGASYNYYADENDNTEIFTGNYDSSTEVRHIFDSPFEAKYVRIEPVHWENSISLRFDLLGCAEVIASTTPIPEEFLTEVTTSTPKEIVCKDPMGLENGLVSDFQLSASSAYDPLTAAKNGKLGSEFPWIPATTDQNPYLQVDFIEMQNISGIITKGSEENDAWVTAYKVQYSKDGKTWNKAADEAGYSKEFPANYDGSSSVANLLPGMLRARYLRVMPTNNKKFIALQIEVLGCYHPEKCQEPMGVEDGLIGNNQMSASSEKDDSLSAEIGRLNSLKAWAPLSADRGQFLQVDFLSPRIITGVVTKGRNDALEWVKDYEISYSNNKKKWSMVKNEDGDVMQFRANADTDTPVINLLPEPIHARYVRIKPTRWVKWPSLRIELLGCREEQECVEPMGMENGLIKDSQIISSSDIDPSSQADQARIKSEGAWSPKPSDDFPFLEIDFGMPQNISAVVTKGRENGLPKGWVTSYKIGYKNELGDYELVRDSNNNVEVFIANDDEDSPVINVLGEEPIETSAVRIIPLTWEGAPNLRIEILGCFHPTECQEPMGMENGMIMDSQLSASSSLDPSLNPEKARLNSESGWSSGDDDDEQYLMVDFMEPRNITGLMTSGHGLLDERVISYFVEYSMDGKNWEKVTRNGEVASFSGSLETNLNKPVLSMFEEPITARYIKIRPTDWSNRISMRFEVLGCYHPYVCKDPMGVENGIITDSQITASSYLSDTTSPFYARLYSESSWMPNELDTEPYLQIDFNSPKNVTAIITKGNPYDAKYVTAYLVMYSDDEIDWSKVLERNGQPMIFKADEGSDVPVINVLPYTIESNFVRIVPIDWNDQISLQVELLGCGLEEEEILGLAVTTAIPEYVHECPDPEEEERSLMDNAVIKASSSAPNSSPYLVLLNTTADIEDDRTGGWVPKVGDTHPYLILEFPETRLLTGIELQGRQDADQRVKSLRVLTSMDNTTWLPVFGPDGYEIIEGNVDSPAKVEVYFKDSANAKFVKVIPEEWHKWPSFRMNLKGCYHPTEVTTIYPPAALPPPMLCPEVPLSMRTSCPKTCPEGQFCDGEDCVDAVDCECSKDGQAYKVGSIFHTEECEKCQCILGGHTKCTKKECPPCLWNQESFYGLGCECECKGCPEDTIICPTSGECLPEERWCDGIEDCPDDERDCLTTLLPEVTTEPGSKKAKGAVKKPEEKVPEEEEEEEEELEEEEEEPEEEITTPSAISVVKPARPEVPTTTSAPLPLLVPDTCEIQPPHIKLLNGENVLYKPCHHIALADIENGRFKIIVHNVLGNRSIEVLTEDHKVEVTSEKQVRLDGHKYNAAQLDVLSKKSDRSLIIEILGAHVIVKSPEIGFDLTYNTLGHLTIKVLPSLKNQLAGLCGFYNDKEGFTLLKSDKTIAYTSRDFGDSWATEEGEDDCKEIVCNIETRSLGVEACKELTDEDFAACYEVLDLKDYMYTCQDFMCECLDESSYEECKCKSFTQIIEKCSNKLGENALKGWRVKHNCSPPPCPEGFVWDDCGPSCQITCGTLTSSDLEGCKDECMSGCFCPTGTLLDGDRCVPPDQCSNEVCHGFGDPHMETFDGYFFPMQAEGTFLFAADEGAEFAVQGIAEPCRPGSKRITCITGIKVTHYGHTVTVSKNEPLLVDEEPMTVEKWPLNVYGMTVIGYPGNTYVVLITSLSVDVRYYGDNSGFAIKIPATRFFNRTLGLCGNCDGKVDENPKKEYSCGWLVKGNKGDCLDSFENLPPAVDVVDSCLALMDEETFGTCHALVNPKNYVDACSFDVTYSEEEDESVCKTLKEYARQCCQAGVVIDKWPEKFGCDTGCENNLEYSSCHDGCPQTCESTKNNFLVLGCEKIMLDGCFCSEGTVFKDGRCIPDELCDACDDDGHMPGDSWSPETCKNCTCKSNLLVSCSTESCPPKPICRSDESLVKQNSNGESCCDSYSCVVSPVFCPPVEEIPSCGEGEIVKAINDEDLCPKFECVCDPVTCASVIFPQDLEDGQVVNINKEECCPKVVVECDPEACPEKPTCTAGMVPAEYEGECCILFRCKPPTDVCVYTHHYEIVHGEQAALEIIDREPVFYRPGETWQDGLCENCTCVENDDQLRPLCIMEQCPTIENMPDNKDYELVEFPNPRKCCPDILKLHCKDKYGNLYVPGDEWQSEEDPCTKYMCESKENGDAQMGKKVLTCPECPKTSDYVPPSKILGQCCGFCRPAKCEENGHIYVIGEEWVPESNPCSKAQCVNDFGGVKIVYTEKSCLVIPEDCPTDKIIDDEKGCCRICNETTEMKCNSFPIPIEETIGFFQFYDPSRGGQCTNTKAVPEILKCSGACHSQSYYSVEDGDFKSVCQCCKVNVTVERMVEMECPDGSVLRKEYMQPQTCQCSKCAPKQKVDLWTNSGQKGFKKSKSPWLQNNNQQQEEDAFNFQQEQREFDFQYPQQEEEDEFLPLLRGSDQVEQEGDDYDFYSSNPYLQRKRKSPQSMDVENTSDHKSMAKRQEVQNSKEMGKRMLPFSDFKIPSANEYAKFTSLWEGAKDKVKDVDLPSFSSMYEGAKGKIKDVELPDFSSMYEGAKDKVKDVELPDFSSMYEGAKDKVKSVELPDFSSMYEGAKGRVKDIKLPSFSSFYEGTKRNFKQMEVPSYLHNTREARKR